MPLTKQFLLYKHAGMSEPNLEYVSIFSFWIKLSFSNPFINEAAFVEADAKPDFVGIFFLMLIDNFFFYL